MDLNTLFTQADAYQEELVALRRDFHRYAESGWSEFRTTEKIIEFLRSHGLDPKFGPEILNLEYAWAYPDRATLEAHMNRAVA